MPLDSLDPDPLPVTVPQWLHDAMAKAATPDFAVSYLCGAMVDGVTLRPRTATAHERLRRSRVAMSVLAEAHITLGKPIPLEDRLPIAGVEPARDRYKRNGRF